MTIHFPTESDVPTVRPAGLGFGGASLGNLRRPISDAQAHAAVQRAWSRGVRYFDTAPHYGLGLSERRLGRALGELPRREFVLSTKVGRLLVPRSTPTANDDEGFAVPGDLERQWDFTAQGVQRSLRESRVRLGIERIDILFVHDPDQAWDGAARDGLRALAELRSAGEVAAIGIGTNSTVGLVELIDEGLLDVLMLAGRYTLLDHRGGLPVLEAAGRRGVAVVVAGVFNSGVLATTRPVVGARFDYRVADPDTVAKVHRLADVCEAHGVDVPSAAIAFVRRQPAVSSVVVGMRSTRDVDDNADRFATAVPDALWRDLVSTGLIDERCAS
ncbi:MAG TPA: aldo/keto reductase [Ilumatobacteraceae bacterium]